MREGSGYWKDARVRVGRFPLRECGGFIVSGGLKLLFPPQIIMNPLGEAVIAGVLGAAIVYGCHLAHAAWLEPEHRAARTVSDLQQQRRELIAEKRQLETKLKELSFPELCLSADDGIGVGFKDAEDGQPTDVAVFFVACLTNRGAASVADNWEVYITPAGGNPERMTIEDHADSVTIKRSFLNRSDFQFSQQQSIREKALAKPIEKGDKIKGFMVCTLATDDPEKYRRPGTKVTIRFSDVTGREYSCSSPIGELSTSPPTHHPGLSRP